MISTTVVTTPSVTNDLTVLATLKTELGITGTSSDAYLADVIRRASDAIGAYCLRPEGFGQQTVVQTFRLVNAATCLILSRDINPDVASVVADGVTLTTDKWLLESGGLLRRLYEDEPIDWTEKKVVVTYTAGYELLSDVPYDLEQAALMAAVAAYRAQGRDPVLRSQTTEGIGSQSWLDPDRGGGVLPSGVRDLLVPYRKVVV